MSKILYITHPSYSVKLFDAESKLIINLDQKIHSEVNYHTSLGDLSSDEIIKLSKKFDSIHFLDYNFDESSNIYNETIILLTYLSHTIPVINFKQDDKKLFLDNNITLLRPDHPILWVYGCSHSHGVGVLEHQIYGKLLSEQLELPLKLITKPGSSSRWSLRHIINSTFRPGDVVVWQLTTPERLSLYDGQTNELMLKNAKNPAILDVFDDNQIYFDHLSILRYGYQYLKALNVSFVITSTLQRNSLYYEYTKEYVKYKEYIYTPSFNVDLGFDNLHFGPQSHNNLANSLFHHIKYLYA